MNTITQSIKLALALVLILPITMAGQTSSRSGKKASVVLTKNNQMQTREDKENDMREVATDTAHWMHYDDVEMYDAWGFLISGEEYDIVSKWNAADISNYEGWQITKIKFIVVNNQPYLKVKVWEGPNYTEVYSQDVPTYNVNSWTEVELDTPVDINTDEDLYVGYYVDMTHTELGGFVTSTDDGPPEDNYGNLCRWNGSWYSDFNNHNLRVYIEPNLAADFVADEDTVCHGSTVNFTNLSAAEESYLWTFEGGTPATSTDENPSVLYDTPGVYDVTLEVTLGDETATETKVDYIHVVDTPVQADQPDGDTDVCTNSSYEYTVAEVPEAADYEWELSPADAGSISWEMNTCILDTDESWTGDFTIKVKAGNVCGDGEWSDEIECTLYESPEEFSLQGGGGYCLGDDGAEITLDGSQSDVEYELYLDGEATGITAEGTGSEISFGLVTEEGVYSALGSNSNCSYQMSGQVIVFIEFPPLEPATPEGPESICEESTAEYTTDEQDDADSFVWILSPAEAGTISGEGTTGTVTWDSEFSGLAYVSVYGINECGDGNPSFELEVSVGAPVPEISGQSLVCDWSDEMYEVADNEGSTFTWTVTGGEITDGQGTYMVTVAWSGEGSGTVSVEEETADGCSGDSEEFEVMIDDCTGIEESLDEKISIYPNPVSGSTIQINNLSDEGAHDVRIYNMNGKLVMQETINGNKGSVNVEKLSKGLYFVSVISTDQPDRSSKLLVN
jgi:PKD repeat protein